MADAAVRHLANGAAVHTTFSERADGDLAVGVDPEQLARRRSALAPLPWTWLHQVHGSRVVRVGAPGEQAGEQADASVTPVAGAVLSVQVADCVPVLMWGARGADGAVVAAVHAGWRGLEAGVVDAAVQVMRAEGAESVEWTIGPCISPGAYEFGEDDLARLARRFGDTVRSTTSTGRPALDLRAALRAAMADAGVHVPPEEPAPVCTTGSTRHWSFRGDGDAARQVGLVWWERP